MAKKTSVKPRTESENWQRHKHAAPHGEDLHDVPVGGVILARGQIELNADRPTVTVTVRNTGDRPVQVGSHYHFFEVNRELAFDREAAFGMRLDIPATTAIRFEPGDEKQVTLVPLAGKRYAHGFANLVDGWVGTGPTPEYRPNLTIAVKKAAELGFKSLPPEAK
ncbi:MAG: Urease subunit beta [Planctomycetota bacterium]|jgi:urease subunit beta